MEKGREKKKNKADMYKTDTQTQTNLRDGISKFEDKP